MHSKKRLIAIIELVVALLIISAIITQAIDLKQNGNDLVNFFHFFTIQSNIILAGVLLMIGFKNFIGEEVSGRMFFIKGAATLYISITGVVYFLLLRNVDVQISRPWVNNVLHYYAPIIALIDWFLLSRVSKQIKFKQTLTWLWYPVLYLFYSLIRGNITNWYPYPFLNPANSDLGYLSVLVVGLIILVFAILLSYLLISVSRKLK